jgi:hypothetical protein
MELENNDTLMPLKDARRTARKIIPRCDATVDRLAHDSASGFPRIVKVGPQQYVSTARLYGWLRGLLEEANR